MAKTDYEVWAICNDGHTTIANGIDVDSASIETIEKITGHFKLVMPEVRDEAD